MPRVRIYGELPEPTPEERTIFEEVLRLCPDPADLDASMSRSIVEMCARLGPVYHEYVANVVLGDASGASNRPPSGVGGGGDAAVAVDAGGLPKGAEGERGKGKGGRGQGLPGGPGATGL